MTSTDHLAGAFAGTRDWVFDLDNTLYPAECNLFAQVADKMNRYIEEMFDIDAEAARKIRRDYYLEYGTTLAGLMDRHNVSPDAFLDYVHDIDHSELPENKTLAEELSKLEGRRLIYTNGSRRHAEMVAEKVGVLHLFDDIFDIKDSEYVPKPHENAFQAFLDKFDVTPGAAVMFEDLPHNLVTAHQFGMRTVLVTSTYPDHPSQDEQDTWETLPEHIHHKTDDISAFLGDVNAALLDAVS